MAATDAGWVPSLAVNQAMARHLTGSQPLQTYVAEKDSDTEFEQYISAVNFFETTTAKSRDAAYYFNEMQATL